MNNNVLFKLNSKSKSKAKAKNTMPQNPTLNESWNTELATDATPEEKIATLDLKITQAKKDLLNVMKHIPNLNAQVDENKTCHETNKADIAEIKGSIATAQTALDGLSGIQGLDPTKLSTQITLLSTYLTQVYAVLQNNVVTHNVNIDKATNASGLTKLSAIPPLTIDMLSALGLGGLSAPAAAQGGNQAAEGDIVVGTGEGAENSDSVGIDIIDPAGGLLGNIESDPYIIYVDGGSLKKPYYNFYSDSAGTTKANFINNGGGLTYFKFYRLNSATSHPFAIKLGDNITKASISSRNPEEGLSGSGSFTIGITPEVTSIPYHCTAHSSMKDKIEF